MTENRQRKQEGFIVNKKEIAEIKKQYKPEYSCIGKIAGCYVDKDKNKVLSFNISPFELPDWKSISIS